MGNCCTSNEEMQTFSIGYSSRHSLSDKNSNYPDDYEFRLATDTERTF